MSGSISGLGGGPANLDWGLGGVGDEVGPAPASVPAPADAPATERPSLGVGDLMLPLAGGFLLPRGEDLIRGRSLKRLSLAEVSKNWGGATKDFQLFGQDPKRDVLMHGSAGAYLGYLPLRAAGHSPLASSLGAAMVGLGIEAGQSLEPGHTVSFGDIARTTLYGTAIGEGLNQVHAWADKKTKKSGNDLYKALAFVTNPYHTAVDLKKNGVGASFKLHF